MGKSDLKAMANRAKARGLQKLRWYCQMCEKQCRDDNGFKCHCASESHQRQMAVFAQAPGRAVARFSDEFLEAFLALPRRAHRGSRVAADAVYNELVADRHHVHMNSTRWATLTEFVQFLGREGHARVELTPKGWFVVYVDRDPEQGRLKRKRRVVSEELVIARQIERAQKSMAMANGDHGSEDECSRSCDADQEEQQEDAKETNNATGKKITVALQRAAPAAPEFNKPRMKFGYEEEEEEGRNKKGKKYAGKATDTRRSAIDDLMDEEEKYAGKATDTRRSAIDDLMDEEEKAKDRSNRKDHWLCPGIVVKVMSKSLGEIDKYVGEIEMLESKNVIRVDQDELETVVPRIGGLVRVVNGAYRGSDARLLSVDMESFSARLRVEKGLYDGRVLEAVEYEDICKVAP